MLLPHASLITSHSLVVEIMQLAPVAIRAPEIRPDTEGCIRAGSQGSEGDTQSTLKVCSENIARRF
jgi:hypothetical protein